MFIGGIGCKKPRYVRVNTITSSVNEAVELFQDEGWVLQPIDKPDDYIKFIEQVSYLEGDYFVKDIHLPDLLIFPAGTTFFNHPGYKKGSIILQDKASCLPVHILSPPPGSVVLDMCAAPGMKTTQIAAALKDEGTVFAVERDTKRYEVLTKMIESSGAQCVKTINKDVLDCSNSDFPGVEYILVDPSCSGSGMVDRVVIAADQLESRLQKLSGFQIMILRSALTRYPQAKRVVYSTCSLYAEENEDVVRQVLETNNNFKLVPAGNFVNNMWKNFGASSFGDIGKYCLYARPEDDLTNGFFVAVFERLEDGENNQFYNGRVSRYMKNHHRNEERTKRRELNRTKEGQSETDKSKNQDANLETEYFASLEEKSQNKTNDKNKTEEQALEVMTTEMTVKKKKKRKQEEETIADVETNPTEINEISEKKKKKKRKTSEHEEVTEQNVKTEKNNSIEHPTKNKKKKHKEKEEIIANPIDIESSEKKKKKTKTMEQEEMSEQDNTEKNHSSEEPAKNKKKKHKEKEEIIANQIDINESSEKKKKTRKALEQEEMSEEDNTEKNNLSEEPAKNKKKKHKEKEEIIANPTDIESSEKKKKKRKTLEQEETSEQDNTEKNNSSEEPAKNKKKKHKEKEEIIVDMETNRMDINESSEKKKKKKRKTSEQEETTEQDINIEKENSNQELATKKKKKHKQEEETSAVLETNQTEINGNNKNKKKKREALEQEETIRQDIDIARENSCQEIAKKKKKKKHDT